MLLNNIEHHWGGERKAVLIPKKALFIDLILFGEWVSNTLKSTHTTHTTGHFLLHPSKEDMARENLKRIIRMIQEWLRVIKMIQGIHSLLKWNETTTRDTSIHLEKSTEEQRNRGSKLVSLKRQNELALFVYSMGRKERILSLLIKNDRTQKLLAN